jgi:hypothetical protein
MQKLKTANLIIVFVLGLLGNHPAVGQTDLKYRRDVVDANVYPWSSIGKIGNSAGGNVRA